MPAVPIGYLVAVIVVAWCTLFALAPPRPRRSSPSNLSFRFGYLLNELPFVAFSWLLASTLLAFSQGDVDTPGGWRIIGRTSATLFDATKAEPFLFKAGDNVKFVRA